MTIEWTDQVPPGRPAHTLDYHDDGDLLRVTHRTYTSEGEVDVEVADTFDFTGTPDGVIDLEAVETVLPVQPILAAERVDGALTVRLLRWTRPEGA